MRCRQPLPRLWLFTDPRWGDDLARGLARLPKGKAGVILRDYDAPDRLARAKDLRQKTRARRLLLFVAADAKLAQRIGADGLHLPRHMDGANVQRSGLCLSAAVHNRRELVRAARAKAALLFISPVFATQSHKDARPLGRCGFAKLAHQARCSVMALGGMNAQRARSLKAAGADGWGAIDAWRQTRDKLKI